LSCKFIAEWRARVASDLDWSDVPNLSRLSLIGAANGGEGGTLFCVAPSALKNITS